MSSLDTILFVALPYVALVVFFVGTILRYRSRPFTYSSLSSQFLENKGHFWSQVPFHYGILVVLAGHVFAFLLPRQLLAWNGVPWRLYLLEATGLAFALLAFVGILNVMIRRWRSRRLKLVTTPMDWVVYALLLLQISTGLHIAVSNTWGSSWFASTLTPYLRSIATFSPEAQWVVAMPMTVKLHIAGLWALLLVFPFTRLVHVLVVPNPYLWRRPQVARWHGATRLPKE
jgi:nitrate reductase gamma subunit